MKTLKKIVLGISVVAFSSLNIFALTPIPTKALADIWEVTCHYDGLGYFVGGSCTTGGQYECDCPDNMGPSEN